MKLHVFGIDLGKTAFHLVGLGNAINRVVHWRGNRFSGTP